MPQKAKDTALRLPKVTIVDFKSIELERTLTALFARIYHNGQDSRLTKPNTTILDFQEHILEQPDRFRDFSKHPDILRGWLEGHLLDLVNRGKHNQQVASPRPLHGFTYRFRNPKHCRDYGSAEHLYEMLWHARNDLGKLALGSMKRFFFEGVDPNTHEQDSGINIDVETQALLSLGKDDMKEDAPVKGSRNPTPPLCIGSADLLADDILRLMQYKAHIPRSVMVEYLKILLGFHLALYHLRLMKLLPEMVRRKGAMPACETSRCPVKPGNTECPFGDCPSQIGLFLDVKNHPGSIAANLAERSAEFNFRRIPEFLKAYYTVKKLDEFATDSLKMGRLPGGAQRWMSVPEVLGLLGDKYAKDRDIYFQARMLNMTDSSGGDDNSEPAEWAQIRRLSLPPLETYVECLVAQRVNYHRKFITGCLDSFTLKNRPGAMLAQNRTRKAPRRFTLDSRLLEVLLQINVLDYDPDTSKYRSSEIQVDRLLLVLRKRYGLFIDRLPIDEGFQEPTIEERQALRANKEAFKDKLREIGFFQDLSDAYITQHVRTRYQIG